MANPPVLDQPPLRAAEISTSDERRSSGLLTMVTRSCSLECLHVPGDRRRDHVECGSQLRRLHLPPFRDLLQQPVPDRVHSLAEAAPEGLHHPPQRRTQVPVVVSTCFMEANSWSGPAAVQQPSPPWATARVFTSPTKVRR